MRPVSPAELRDYFSGLARANEYEIDELRSAPIELKLRQLWALMSSAELLAGDAQRASQAQEVRERWARLYQALSA
jgi:hypothetical protein